MKKPTNPKKKSKPQKQLIDLAAAQGIDVLHVDGGIEFWQGSKWVGDWFAEHPPTFRLFNQAKQPGSPLACLAAIIEGRKRT